MTKPHSDLLLDGLLRRWQGYTLAALMEEDWEFVEHGLILMDAEAKASREPQKPRTGKGHG